MLRRERDLAIMRYSFEVVFQPDGKRGRFQSKYNLLEAARRLGVDINSICGGVGACGKCIIRITEGTLPKPNSTDKRFIDDKVLKLGFRLACQTRIEDDLKVVVPKESRTSTQRLQTEGLETNIMTSPVVSKKISQDMIEILYDGDILRKIYSKETQILGFAVDIGSTKLAGFLMDLTIGNVLSVVTAMNPQIPYGEDIISRITSAIESKENNRLLHLTLVESVKQLLTRACIESGQNIEDVYDIVLVGNTAMQHFILGSDIRLLSRSPFIPESLEHRDLPPDRLKINSSARVHILPLIAGFIGADCVAASLATGIHKSDQLSFLMDIGTNTEIVVGSKDGLVACSCASGPAFEGAHIKYGMRAASGAIEGVWIDEKFEPRVKVIDDVKPVGICGSGLIDLLSEMLKAGIVDSSGRFAKVNHPRLRKNAGIWEYVVVWRNETGVEDDICITQKDVRELQKGKAAIFSGSHIALKYLGLEPNIIEHIYMAGAFGTYINGESAINIGMIPEFNLLKINQVGNAAGTGARMSLISKESRKEAQHIRKKVEYIELARHPEYHKVYLDALMLPHKDLSLFPETVRKLVEMGWVKGKPHY
jgi:uncharacterized 2Fe-2S/4Fe-4S cluster protein (DUF4445 family)